MITISFIMLSVMDIRDFGRPIKSPMQLIN